MTENTKFEIPSQAEKDFLNDETNQIHKYVLTTVNKKLKTYIIIRGLDTWPQVLEDKKINKLPFGQYWMKFENILKIKTLGHYMADGYNYKNSLMPEDGYHLYSNDYYKGVAGFYLKDYKYIQILDGIYYIRMTSDTYYYLNDYKNDDKDPRGFKYITKKNLFGDGRHYFIDVNHYDEIDKLHEY